MQRRAFLASGAALAARPAAAATTLREDRVSFVGDGISLNPIEYSRLLARVVEEKNIQPDSYALGGAIGQIEERFAAILGKEQAVFLPTGTLANHLAVRLLAGQKRRVLPVEYLLQLGNRRRLDQAFVVRVSHHCMHNCLGIVKIV